MQCTALSTDPVCRFAEQSAWQGRPRSHSKQATVQLARVPTIPSTIRTYDSGYTPAIRASCKQHRGSLQANTKTKPFAHGYLLPASTCNKQSPRRKQTPKAKGRGNCP